MPHTISRFKTATIPFLIWQSSDVNNFQNKLITSGFRRGYRGASACSQASPMC
jgi:hypothetical protein